MALILGRSPLTNILGLKSLKRNIKKWYTGALADVVSDILDGYQRRNEVMSGLLVTEGSTLGSGGDSLHLDVSAGVVMINGRITSMAALSDQDFADGTPPTGTEGILNQAGAAASGLDLDANEVAYITIIACDSDGDGSRVQDEAAVLVALMAGTSLTAPGATAHLTSIEIQEALDASAGNATGFDHSGYTGWCHVAQLILDENGGSAAVIESALGAADNVAFNNRNNRNSNA